MNQEQKKWQQDFWKNFGVIEYLRFGCAVAIWNLLLILLLITPVYIFHKSIGNLAIVSLVIVFFVTLFLFVVLTYRWRPAYILFRKILGNKNLPIEPMPRSETKSLPKQIRQPLPWYGYLPGIWGWIMGLALLYVVIRYLLK